VIYCEGYCDECGGHDCEDPACQLIRACCACGDTQHEHVGIHLHDDGMWWFREIGHDCYARPRIAPPAEQGPFTTIAEARQAADAYLSKSMTETT
jgi:hypothetical protein